MNEILQRIEVLRTALYQLVEEADGNLLHPNVIAASQKLDVEMSRWQSSQPVLVLPLAMRMAAV